MSLVIRRHSLATPHFHGTGQGGVVVSRFDLITSKDYTVEVRNRFKGLDLIDRVPNEVWNEVRDIVQETGIKTIPMEGNAKKQNGCLRRPYK